MQFVFGKIRGISLTTAWGYFESTTETVLFAQKLHDCYTNKFQLPHVVYSNVESVYKLGDIEKKVTEV